MFREIRLHPGTVSLCGRLHGDGSQPLEHRFTGDFLRVGIYILTKVNLEEGIRVAEADERELKTVATAA